MDQAIRSDIRSPLFLADSLRAFQLPQKFSKAALIVRTGLLFYLLRCRIQRTKIHIQRIDSSADHLRHRCRRQVAEYTLHLLIRRFHLRHGFLCNFNLVITEDAHCTLICLRRLQSDIVQNIIHIAECLLNRIPQVCTWCRHQGLITLICTLKGIPHRTSGIMNLCDRRILYSLRSQHVCRYRF